MFVLLLKDKLRKLISHLGIDFTQNLKYDRITHQIIKQTMSGGGIGIDVGCHKGEILDQMIKYSPHVAHFGFEPLPHMYEQLQKKYGKLCNILPYALSDATGTTVFNFVKNAPSYSGIQERKYDIANPIIEKIDVALRRMDDVIDPNLKISLIKIDVEGAELGVLKGGISTIKRHKPVVLFEFGLGASDMYGTTPNDIFDYFNTLDYNIFLLEDYVTQKPFLTVEGLQKAYHDAGEFYFVAASTI
jgi:FkbM family methyltransferase